MTRVLLRLADDGQKGLALVSIHLLWLSLSYGSSTFAAQFQLLYHGNVGSSQPYVSRE